MRRFILFHLDFGIILWLATSIAFYTSNQTIRLIAGIMGLVMLFVTMFSSIYFSVNYAKDWFKSKKELDDEREKERKSWEKANKLCNILGHHEAIKLWNEEKDLKPE